MVPSAFRLTLKTHLQPIAFLPGGKSANSQVLLSLCASSSSFAAFDQSAASERPNACTYVVGSGPNDAAKDWTGWLTNSPGKSSCSPKCSTRSNSTSCASLSCSYSSSELSMIGVGSLCTLHHSPGALHFLALRQTSGVK